MPREIPFYKQLLSQFYGWRKTSPPGGQVEFTICLALPVLYSDKWFIPSSKKGTFIRWTEAVVVHESTKILLGNPGSRTYQTEQIRGMVASGAWVQLGPVCRYGLHTWLASTHLDQRPLIHSSALLASVANYIFSFNCDSASSRQPLLQYGWLWVHYFTNTYSILHFS